MTAPTWWDYVLLGGMVFSLAYTCVCGVAYYGFKRLERWWDRGPVVLTFGVACGGALLITKMVYAT